MTSRKKQAGVITGLFIATILAVYQITTPSTIRFAVDIEKKQVQTLDANVARWATLYPTSDIKIQIYASHPFLRRSDVQARYYVRDSHGWQHLRTMTSTFFLDASPSFELNIAGRRTRLRAVFKHD